LRWFTRKEGHRRRPQIEQFDDRRDSSPEHGAVQGGTKEFTPFHIARETTSVAASTDSDTPTDAGVNV
jgi:hypothetical protein